MQLLRRFCFNDFIQQINYLFINLIENKQHIICTYTYCNNYYYYYNTYLLHKLLKINKYLGTLITNISIITRFYISIEQN